MPKLAAIGVFPEAIAPGDLHEMEEVVGRFYTRRGQDTPVTFTIGLRWEEAQGQWNASVVLNGIERDASWESKTPDFQHSIVIETAFRGSGTLEIVIVLEGEIVRRLEVPVEEA